MPFPATPLETRVELYLGGTWIDVTSHAYVREGIAITRGRADEGSGIGPSSCRVVLNNRDGRFSPRNPRGPYYGWLTRNTPIRVSALLGTRRWADPTTGARATAPDTAGISITGDLDLRIDLSIPSWATTTLTVVGKFTDPADRSWAFTVNSDATIQFWWSATGAAWLSATSTVPLPQTAGRQTIRATIDVDNGAAGRTITFYTGPSVTGPWTQLGSAVVQAGVTSIFNSAATLGVGTSGASGLEVFAARVLQGIDGTVRANPDFSIPAEGATSFTDAAGNTWTASGSSSASARRYRFHGEVAAWPQSWDVAGVDVRTGVEAAGVFRRLGQGADPLKSTTQRWVLRGTVPVVAYWPMEDAQGSTTIASGLPGGIPMSIVGTPELASNETFASSNALPVLAGASFAAEIPSYNETGTIYVQMLVDMPAAGEPNGIVFRLLTTGTAARWDVWDYADVIYVNAYDAAGTLLMSSPSAFGPQGKPESLILQLEQSGADISWGLYQNGYVNPTPGLGPHSGTLAGYTVGAATHITVNPDRLMTTTAVGHLIVYSAVPNGTVQISALRGYIGETAGRRIERLCSEEGITFRGYGDLDESVALGPQRPAPLLEVMADAETADFGQVFELREVLGIGYRTRESRQHQAATLALSYGDLTDLLPVEDDQGTRNDVTVSRVGGSSARATLESGPLSVLPPPAGVGRYTDSVELNVLSDNQLADQAAYRVALGTIDEARYPDLLVRLETPSFVNSAALTDAALAVDHGDLITITGLPTWLPPETVRQNTIGQSEVLDPYAYSINFVCVPAVPTGSAGLWDDASDRYSGDGSTLTSAISSSALSLSITTPTDKPLWTTDPADFPLDVLVGGERITLSAISGTTSPQTATVSARAVNGVSKAQIAGAAIDIADPVYYTF